MECRFRAVIEGSGAPSQQTTQEFRQEAPHNHTHSNYIPNACCVCPLRRAPAYQLRRLLGSRALRKRGCRLCMEWERHSFDFKVRGQGARILSGKPFEHFKSDAGAQSTRYRANGKSVRAQTHKRQTGCACSHPTRICTSPPLVVFAYNRNLKCMLHVHKGMVSN